MIQIILNIVYSTSVYLVLSKSFHIYYVTHRFFNIAQSISIILGAYLVFLFVRETSYPFWVSIFFSVVLCVLIMLIVEKIVYLPLGNRGVEGWRMMLVSLGINVAFLNIIEMIWGSGMLSFKTWGTSVGVSIGDAYLSTVQLWSLGACVFLSILWGVIENHTMLGMKIKATSSNHEMIPIYGLNPNQVSLIGMIVATLLTSLAGIMIAADIDITPTMGFDWMMYGVIAMIIGGMGGIRTMVLGSLLVAVSQHLAAYYFDSKWMNAMAYIILVIFLYFRPFGFSGKKLKKTEV